MDHHPDCLYAVGIDTGSSKMGFSVIELNLVTDTRRVVHSETWDASKALTSDSWFAELRGKRDARLTYMAKVFYERLNEFNPDLVAVESAFANRYRISAYEALLETLAVLRATLYRYTKLQPLIKIDPVTVKNHVGVSHIKTDKEDVERAVKQLYAQTATCSLQGLDEHAYDSVAIAHTALDIYVEGRSVTSTRKAKRKGKRKAKRRRKKKSS